MLRFLRIRNFALIDQLELHFENGFNLLSGETGAGKSIIVDALSLLAGAKASAGMVRTGESRAIIEAIFETDCAELERLGLDAEDGELIIRREISSTNAIASTSTINRRPCRSARTGSAASGHPWQHEQQTLLDIPANSL
jgi:DNA repair protein RecN (Recombination protein N)